MDTRISGKDIKCPNCNCKLIIGFQHTIDDKGLDEIQDTLEIDSISSN